jgi:hypothetical protein
MYGIIEVQFDGRPVGDTFDAWSPTIDTAADRVRIGRVAIGKGTHTITMKIVGKNPKSTGNIVSVKRWLLKPAAE